MISGTKMVNGIRLEVSLDDPNKPMKLHSEEPPPEGTIVLRSGKRVSIEEAERMLDKKGYPRELYES